MTLGDEYISLLQKYFESELSKEELEKFTRRIKDDPAFAEEFRLREKIELHLLKVKEYNGAKRFVFSVIDQNQSIFKNKWTYFSIAASITLLIGIYFLIPHDNIHKKMQTELHIDSNSLILQKEEDRFFGSHFGSINSDKLIITQGQNIEILKFNDPLILNDQFQNIAFIILYDFCDTVDTLYYIGDNILPGNYKYIGDSVILGDKYWLIRSLTTNNLELLISEDSLVYKSK